MDMLQQPVLVLNEKFETITCNEAARIIFSIQKKEQKLTERIFQDTSIMILKKFLKSNK